MENTRGVAVSPFSLSVGWTQFVTRGGGGVSPLVWRDFYDRRFGKKKQVFFFFKVPPEKRKAKSVCWL